MQSEFMDRRVAALLAMTVFFVQGRCAVSGRIRGARNDDPSFVTASAARQSMTPAVIANEVRQSMNP
jgi:hypothetical protein